MTMIEGMVSDVRLALRGLVRRPGFAVTVVLTLALGLGANGAIFRVLDRVVLRPLPYEGGDRMVYLVLRSPEIGFHRSPRQEELDRWREGARTLDALEAFRPGTRVLAGRGSAELLDYTEVSEGLPGIIGLRPLVGRTFLNQDHDPGAPPVVMLSERYWRSAHGGSPDVVGRTLELDGTHHTVVGVWPEDAPLGMDQPPDLWLPVERGAEADPRRATTILAVLSEGASPAAARDELAGLLEGVGDGSAPTWVPVIRSPSSDLGGTFLAGIRIAYAGVLVVLLVAMVNAAGLLFNRAVSREEELGVRLALGGSGGRLVRHFLVEGTVLSLLGAGAAVLVAWAGVAFLEGFAPPDFPGVRGGGLDRRMVGYVGGLALVTALVCGLIPALHVRSPRVKRLLTSRGQVGRRRWRGLLGSGLVAGQVALALMLVVGAGLTLRSLQSIRSVDPGMDIERLVVFSLRLPEERYGSPEEQEAFFRSAMDRMEGVPGVEGVTLSGYPPFRFPMSPGTVHLAGRVPDEPEQGFTATGGGRPGYFELLGIPVLEGRTFTADDEGREVVVVNEAFARRYAGEDVVGRELVFSDSETRYVILGVVGDIPALGLADDPDRVQVYFPEMGQVTRFERFIVRTAGPPGEMIPALRRRISEIDPGLPLRSVTTGPELLAVQTADQRFLAVLLATFSVVALLLAVLGVYSSVSLAVRRRTREMGVRMALGAGVPRMVRHVLALGLKPVAGGMLVGSLAAVVLSRFVEPVLYETPPTDPLSFGLAAAILLAAGSAACLVPARRAFRLEPSEVLREE